MNDNKDKNAGLPVHQGANPEGQLGIGQTPRELDALAAVEVMGWTPRGSHPIHGSMVFATGASDSFALPFSSDMNAAWLLVGKLLHRFQDQQPYFELRTCGSYWTARFLAEATDWSPRDISRDGDTAPEAICRMAIAVVQRRKQVPR